MDTEKIKEVKQKIKDLQKEREQVILEKGLAAQENADLRENFAYDYWNHKEIDLTHKIQRLSGQLFIGTRKKKPVKKPSGKETFEFKPHKWL